MSEPGAARAKLLPVKPATKVLLALKIAILAGGLGLEVFAHLSPAMTTLIGIVLGGFGLTAAAHEFGGAKFDPAAIAGALGQLLAQVPGMGPASAPAAPSPTVNPPAAAPGPGTTGAAAVIGTGALLCFLGCTPAPAVPPAAANTIAAQADVGAYGAELDACIADNDTRTAIDACRAKARARFCDPASQMAPGCPPSSPAKPGGTP